MRCHIVELFRLLRSPHLGSCVLRLTPSRREQLAVAPSRLAVAPSRLAVAPWRLAVGQRIAVERSCGEGPSPPARQSWAALITAVAIVTRTISIAVEAPTTVVAAQSSEAALLLAEPPYVEAALPAAE